MTKLLRVSTRAIPPLIVLACVALSALLPIHGRNDDSVAESIAAAKRRAGAAPDKRAELDWRPLSFLAYDRLIVMDGFATADDLRRRLGFPWPEANEAALGSDADDMVLVFSVGRRVVAWAHVGRDDADFACLAGFRLMRREALMVLTRSSVDGHAKVALQTVPRRYRKRPACLLPA